MRSRVLITCVLLCCIAAAWLCAQESRGTILGRATDQSGAVLAGVAVEAINTATGVTVRATTNGEGNYRIPFLISGTYRLSFTLTGFQKLVRDNVDLRVADLLTVDGTLLVGASAQEIEVRDERATLEAANASLGQVVSRSQLEDLPFREGNPHELIKLAPGVTTHTHLRLNKPGQTNVLSQVSVDGSTQRHSDFALDGIPNTAGDQVSYSPPAAAVQEFKVQTTTYDASLGYTAGGVVNVVTRSGANAFHGDAWYFYRNSRFDSKDFLQTLNDQPKSDYTDKRGGGALGGPIVRNRAHFFVAAEFNPYKLPEVFLGSMPTARMRQGDFSEFNSLGRIYDPLSGRPDPANPARVLRDPFPSNLIPPVRLNAISRKLVDFFPLPNIAGVTNNFLLPNPVATQTWKTITGRVDYILSSANRMFARYSEAKWNQCPPDMHMNHFSTGGDTVRNIHLVALDDVHTFSGALILNTRFGWTFQRTFGTPYSTGVDLTKYGFSPALAKLSADPPHTVLPSIDIAGYNGYRQNIGYDGVNRNRDVIYSGAANLMYVRGNHTMTIGSEYRHYSNYNWNPARALSPRYIFDTSWTRGPYSTSGGIDQVHGLSGFMLGHPASGFMSVLSQRTETTPRSAVFLQDDWRLSRRFTLNLGLRYEVELPTKEASNASANGIDLQTALPIAAAVTAAYAKSPVPEVPADRFRVVGGLRFAGVDGFRAGLWESRRANFMPRAGFAFQTTPKTVLRGGYGVFYDTLGVTRMDVIQTGFSRTTNITTTLDDVLPVPGVFADPFPDGLLQPAGSSLGLMTSVGDSTVIPYLDGVKTPYSERFSFGLQRQLPGSVVVDVSYLASRGHNLPVSRALDAIPIEYLSKSPTRDQARIDYLNATFPNPLYGLIPAGSSLGGRRTLNRSQFLRPYPAYPQIQGTETTGVSWYDALQVRVERRMANGFTVNAAYTFSKALERMNFRDPSEALPEKRLSDSDRAQAFTFNSIIELPYGRGRRWGGGVNRVVNTALGGWQFSPLYRWESGYPLGLGNVILKPGASFANLGLPAGERRWDRVFNTGLFETSAALQPSMNVRYYSTRFGNARVDGFKLLDLMLSKKINVTERVQVDLRAEMYNALNTANLRAVNTTPTSPAFGRYATVNGYARQIQLAVKMRF